MHMLPPDGRQMIELVSPSSGTAPALSADEIFPRIERLAGLYEKRIITAEKFNAKKAELLARL